jgi:hypothetical protein
MARNKMHARGEAFWQLNNSAFQWPQNLLDECIGTTPNFVRKDNLEIVG